MILEGLHRTKLVKEKGKDIVLTKKPKRPSKRIEVLSVEEARVLEFLEKPFDEYKEYLTSLGKTVAIADISKARNHLSKIIQAMWLVVEKVSAPLTKRRTPLVSHLTENERKKTTINKGFIEAHKNNNFADCKDDKSNIYTLSPIPLLLKAGSREMISQAAKCDVDIHYILVPSDVEGIVRDCMTAFSVMTEIELVVTKPVKSKKSRKAQKVERFSDEEDPQPRPNRDETED
jgi:hypothetical protein